MDHPEGVSEFMDNWRYLKINIWWAIQKVEGSQYNYSLSHVRIFKWTLPNPFATCLTACTCVAQDLPPCSRHWARVVEVAGWDSYQCLKSNCQNRVLNIYFYSVSKNNCQKRLLNNKSPSVFIWIDHAPTKIITL